MPTIKNGVNVDNLLTAIAAVEDDPANGKLTFTVGLRYTLVPGEK